MFPCLRFSCSLSGFFLSFKCLLLPLAHVVCFCQGELFFNSNVRGRCFHLNWCCLYDLPDIETDRRRHFEHQSWEKFNRCVNWDAQMCFFEFKLLHIITCDPHRRCNCFRLEKRGDWNGICVHDCWFCFLHAKRVRIWRKPCKLPKNFRVQWHFELSWGIRSDTSDTGRTISDLTGSSALGYPQS